MVQTGPGRSPNNHFNSHERHTKNSYKKKNSREKLAWNWAQSIWWEKLVTEKSCCNSVYHMYKFLTKELVWASCKSFSYVCHHWHNRQFLHLPRLDNKIANYVSSKTLNLAHLLTEMLSSGSFNIPTSNSIQCFIRVTRTFVFAKVLNL